MSGECQRLINTTLNRSRWCGKGAITCDGDCDDDGSNDDCGNDDDDGDDDDGDDDDDDGDDDDDDNNGCVDPSVPCTNSTSNCFANACNHLSATVSSVT